MSSLRSDHGDSPFMRPPDRPSMLRRSSTHDYTSPSGYLLTLRKAVSTAPLSEISGTPAAPVVTLTDAGRAIAAALEDWPVRYPQIRIYARAVMPDHIHVAMRVETSLPTGLSRCVAWMMGCATRHYDNGMPFFAKGFNDKIAFTNQIFERQILYVRDNPRRLLIKRMFPDFYRRRWHLLIDDNEFMAIGNIQLLRAPELLQVRFSRKFGQDEFASYVRRWQRCVYNGGTLVSPFIHPRERELKVFATENSGSYIRICENGFDERFAPSGREFELMAEGRLLLIAPVEHDTRKQVMTYSHAQQMNSLAAKIAAGPSRFSIVTRTK